MDNLNIPVLVVIILLAFAAAELEELYQTLKRRKEVEQREESKKLMERMTGVIDEGDYYGEVDRRGWRKN